MRKSLRGLGESDDYTIIYRSKLEEEGPIRDNIFEDIEYNKKHTEIKKGVMRCSS